MLRSALIRPAARYGSLGDEAALLGLGRGYDRYRVGSSRDDDWPGYDMRRPGSGLDAYTHVLAIGADVFDGSFKIKATQAIVTLLRDAPHAVIAVVGFSFRPDARPEVRDLIRALPSSTVFVPRDAHSLKNFASMTGRSAAVLGADPAFLMHAEQAFESKRPKLTRWIEIQRDRSRPVVGLNVNALLREGEGGALTQAVMELPGRFPDVAFVLIPHDTRFDPSDVTMLASVGRRFRRNTAMAHIRPSEVKALCARLDFVVTQRMHVAIAALGTGTPALAADYNHKVAGTLGHFGQEDLAIGLADAARIDAAFRALLRDHAARRAQVTAKLPAVMDLARRNWV